MSDELKQLIEDAAKLLGFNGIWNNGFKGKFAGYYLFSTTGALGQLFNPADPERGDLMKVWLALPECTMGNGFLDIEELGTWTYKHGDYQSLALAVLRAASVVLKARNAQ